MLYRYNDTTGFRVVLIISKARKWMRVVMIEPNSLRIKKMRLTEERYMFELQLDKGQRRKAYASLRRLARSKNTSPKVRKEVVEILKK